jgi:hypothetical protein
MPGVAEFVAKLREAFGDATIDEAVARGKAGEPTFFARENGRTIGTKPIDEFNRWQADGSVRERHYCQGCNGACIGTGQRCSERRPIAPLKVPNTSAPETR